MKRFAGLLRDTWLLWIVLFVAGTLLTIFFSIVFVSTYPIAVCTFIYFGLVRYDDQGEPREM